MSLKDTDVGRDTHWRHDLDDRSKLAVHHTGPHLHCSIYRPLVFPIVPPVEKTQHTFPSAYAPALSPVIHAAPTSIHIETGWNGNPDDASSSWSPFFQNNPQNRKRPMRYIHVQRYIYFIACRVQTTRRSLQISVTLRAVHARTKTAVGRFLIFYLSV